MREPHAAQHVWRLGELNILVADDLDAVAPRVEKVEKRSRESLDSRVAQCFAGRFLVVDHQSKVTPLVDRLRATLLERKELVSEVDESHGFAFASKFEIEQAGVKIQSRFDVTDFESDMIEPDDARFFRFRHRASVPSWVRPGHCRANDLECRVTRAVSSSNALARIDRALA